MSENAKKLPIITISREYGAGGRSVAKALAPKLGLEFYDIDLVRLTSKLSGYSEEDVKREGEDLSSSVQFINQFLSTNAYNNSYDIIFQAQKDVVLDLAKNPCIIVGRCSNIILEEAGIPSFDVFLFADKEHRLKRAAELAENGHMNLEKYLDQRDAYRKNYFKHYTKHELGDYKGYNLCLDTGTLGMDYCADLIAQVVTKLYL